MNNNSSSSLSDVESIILELPIPSEEYEDKDSLVHRVPIINEEVIIESQGKSYRYCPVSIPSTQNSFFGSNTL